MSKKISISSIINRCRNAELFVRPSRKLPGEWTMFEFYYDDDDNNLVHYDESRIKTEKLFYEINFAENKIFKHQTNLFSVPLISKLKDGRWNISRNFVTVINPDNLDCKFQFAIDRGVLKLLKKNSAGRIELFGFFRKQNVPVTSV